jgi:hypothetical protein
VNVDFFLFFFFFLKIKMSVIANPAESAYPRLPTACCANAVVRGAVSKMNVFRHLRPRFDASTFIWIFFSVGAFS